MLTALESTSLDRALELIRALASDIGPRRPCSEAERRAADLLVNWLQEHGIEARTEPFRGYASLGYPYGLIFATALAGGLLQRKRSHLRRLGDVLTASSALTGAVEADLRRTPLSDALSRGTSVNVIAHVPAAAEPRQRVCLCAHLDTTRSGLMFHPAIVAHLARLLQIPVGASLLLVADPLIRRLPVARRLHVLGIAGAVLALVLLAERELRGSDVPGANDNASGCAVTAQLIAECAASPLEHTEVGLLVSGCEESGLLGAQAYARTHHARAKRTIFVNFDSVGGDAPLTYILREGSATLTRPASPRLVEIAATIARSRPDLGLVGARTTPGLPTDATVMRALGYEAITFLAQTDTIPNYHWPTDTYENLAPATIARALEVGREMLGELDRGVVR
jgi:acetylornithine deacetylase/succinyl-diaminopimelate desuccinylase-like protein